MTRQVPLTRGLFATVDDSDFEALAAFRWFAQPSSGLVYAGRNVPSQMPHVRQQRVYMHRQLLGLTDNSARVDHIDGNGLNNTRANLRLATVTQNAYNQRRMSTNTSGYRGVSRTCGNKWRVYIKAEGTSHEIGIFDDLIEAARAYDEAAVALHGRYARLNFPL